MLNESFDDEINSSAAALFMLSSKYHVIDKLTFKGI